MIKPYDASFVVVEGSSTAYGYFDARYHGWANRLCLEALPGTMSVPNEPVIIDNRAVPGFTLNAILKRFPSDLSEHQARAAKLASVLSVGINESKIPIGEKRPAVSFRQFGLELGHYLTVAERHNARTVLVGPQPMAVETFVSPHTGSTLERDLVEEYVEIMRARAAADGVPFVDAFELFGDEPAPYISADQIHPNALGHMVLHGAISKELHGLGAL